MIEINISRREIFADVELDGCMTADEASTLSRWYREKLDAVERQAFLGTTTTLAQPSVLTLDALEGMMRLVPPAPPPPKQVVLHGPAGLRAWMSLAQNAAERDHGGRDRRRVKREIRKARLKARREWKGAAVLTLEVDYLSDFFRFRSS